MSATPPPALSWREYASQAGAAGQWGQAAIALRRHLALCKDSRAQLELGECYFHLGQYTAAALALESAIEDELVRPEVLVNLGHLACARQDFVGALIFFEEAFGLVDRNSPTAEVIGALLAKVQPLGTAKLAATRPADHTRLVFSCPGMTAKRVPTPGRSNLGEADYSYAFAARGFLEALHKSGTEPELISHPELVANGASFVAAKHCVHLRFSPPTNPRMIRGATNILIFAWEFDELPLMASWPHPFADRRAMLDRFDEVWMPSRHGVAVIDSLTQATVRFVPSPVLPRQAGRHWQQGQFARGEITKETLPDVKFVPLSVFPRFQGILNADAKASAQSLRSVIGKIDGCPKIFLTIANPYDQRKNLRPLIEAFTEHARYHSDAILLIKSSAFDHTEDDINSLIMAQQLSRNEEALGAFVSRSIWICSQSLSDDDLDALYAVSDFYICSPIAEGQNLPLLEAMLRGCVAIAPRHTAMLDYITAKNAVIIPSRRGPPTEHFRKIYEMRSAEVDLIDTADVQAALNEATLLSVDQMTAMTAAAEFTVRTQYAAEIVSSEWHRLRSSVTGAVFSKSAVE